MKKFITTILLIAAFTSMKAQQTMNNANEKFQVEIFSGVNLPTGNYGDHYGFAQTGITNGIHADYYFSKHFGVGIDARHFVNKTNSKEVIRDDFQALFDANPGDFGQPLGYTIPSSNVTNVVSGTTPFSEKWKTTMLTLGATFRQQFGQSKFGMEAFVKGGIAWVKSPSYMTNITDPYIVVTAFQSNPLAINASTINTAVGVAGLRFNYNFAPNFTLAVSGDYTKTMNMNYKYNTWNVTASGVNSGIPLLVPGDNPTYEINQQLQLQNVSFNLGVKYRFD